MSRLGMRDRPTRPDDGQRRGLRTDRGQVVLRGLAPVSAVSNSAEGKAALASNFTAGRELANRQQRVLFFGQARFPQNI
jgi:hypothetical protein